MICLTSLKCIRLKLSQLENKIKTLRSNRGGEYAPTEMVEFCKEHSIIHEVTPSDAPQSNGVAERKNSTLVDMVNAMLHSSGLPNNFWGETLYSACLILLQHNRRRGPLRPCR